jgi:cob(I)alamin adenosyltransferase
MKIYTRTGDSGETSLLGGKRVSKSSIRVDAYGEVDELNATLGVARAEAKHPEIQAALVEIQRDLFSLGARLADPAGQPPSEKVALDSSNVQKLEKHIDRFESSLPALAGFILPGGSKAGALLHQARSICRRAERKLAVLSGAEAVPPPALPYLNRLSDLLFVMARLENQRQNVEDESW